MQQLPLQLVPRGDFSFDNYVEGSNSLAVNLLKQMAQPASSRSVSEVQLYLWAEQGLGKSHLLQAACQMAARHDCATSYLPLSELLATGPGILDGLEQLELVCLDELEVVAGRLDWEEGLFTLIKRMRAAHKYLVFAARLAPNDLSLALPDFRSRLSWGPVFQLQPLGDSEKIQALKQRAMHRGVVLPDNAAEYLLRHYPRDLSGLFQRMDQLEEASLSFQRRMTIPFIKSVLGHGI